MWKDLAWNVFKVTGNIELYMICKENIQKMINEDKKYYELD